MADSFDPYHSLLGIPPAEQPANHYRMLGVSLFEASRDVISNAADARMTYLRSLQTGPRAALTQRILNELSAARLVLLDPQKKAEYDRQLAAQLQTQTPSPPQLQSQGHPRPQVTRQPSTSLLASQIAQPAPPNAEGEFQVTAAARTSRAGRHSTPIAALAIGGSVCAFVLLMVVVIALQGGGGVVGGGSASEDGQKGNGGSSSAVASAAGQSPQPPVANSVGTRPPSTGSTPPNAASSGAPSSKPESPNPAPPTAFPPVSAQPTAGPSAPTTSGAGFVAQTPPAANYDELARHAEAAQRAPAMPTGKILAPPDGRWKADAKAWRYESNGLSCAFLPTPFGWREVARDGYYYYPAEGGGADFVELLRDNPQVRVRLYRDRADVAVNGGQFATTHQGQWSEAPYPFARAVRLPGDGALRFDQLTNLFRKSQSFFVEVWFRPNAFQPTGVAPLVSCGATALNWEIQSDGSHRFVLRTEGKPFAFFSLTRLDADWSKLCFGADGDRFFIAVNGQGFAHKIQDFLADESVGSPLAIGGRRGDSLGAWIDIAAVRVSSSCRLAAAGDPDAVSLPINSPLGLPDAWQVDSTTLALLDFNDGISMQVVDKAGRHSARIEAPGYAINALTAPPFFKRTPLAANVQPTPSAPSLAPSPSPESQAGRIQRPSAPSPNAAAPITPTPARPSAEQPTPDQPAPGPSAPAFAPGEKDSQTGDDTKLTPAASGPIRRPTIDSQPRRSTRFGSIAARRPVPDPASIADTLAKVRELHKAEYDSVKNAAGKSALATKLAEQARAVSDDPTSQYVLLDEARRLALEAVQLAEAANWIDELSATFEVDPHRLKVEAAQRVHDLLVGPPPAPTVARVQMIDATLAATMLAVESRRYDEADQLAQIAVSQSKTKQSIDVEVRRRAQNMADMAASMHEEFQAAAAAEEKLKTTPDDAEANLLVGRFRCFRAEQWDVGLAFLAKAANPALAEAARLDLAAGDSAKARDSAASAWEKAAESAVGTERRECLERAYRTYELAINKGLKGVDRELARKRLDALRGLLPPLHPTISQTLADGATVEVHPGLLGRVLVGGRDTGVLVTYRPGQSLATATLKQIVTESRMKGVVQIELAGFMATTSRTTYARQFGGGKTMPQRLLIDSKVIATVDAQQAQKETTLDLPAQRHTLVWQLQGTDPSSAVSLELRDSNRITSVTTYYTKSMLENLRTSTLKKGETRKEYRLDGN